MNRRRADTAVSVLLSVVLLVGGSYSWQVYQRRRAIDGTMGSMMESSMRSMHGPDPLWLAFGTLLLVAVIGGGYLLVREEFSTVDDSPQPTGEPAAASVPTETDRADPRIQDDPDTEPAVSKPQSINPEAHPQKRVLDLLPDDERRVLEPVIDSPGVTQIELRDRADFSKSKVSQTVSDLEARGLLYRERQGRTYRVYPSDDLKHQPN